MATISEVKCEEKVLENRTDKNITLSTKEAESRKTGEVTIDERLRQFNRYSIFSVLAALR